MTGRNDSCPCGSGKKYKHCHLHADEATPHALRVIRGGLARSHTAANPQGLSLAWEVDLVPLAAAIDDDPSARMTTLLVAADDFVLHVDLLAHPPTDPGEIAALFASATRTACDTHGLLPDSITVRYASLVAPLRAALAEGGHAAAVANLSHAADLPAVDAAIGSLHQHMGIAQDDGPRPRISRPDTWAAWGLEREQLARFFAAAARYFQAAPWRLLMNEDVMRAKIRGGATWWAIAMGAAREVFGLVIYAEREDIERIREGSLGGDPDAAADAIRGATISIGFEPREEMSKRVREEIRREKWPIAGPNAYPMMLVLNTPGGGVSAQQMEDLIAVLTAVPAFVARHADGIAGVVPVRLPLSYRNTASGVTITLEDEWL